MGAGADQRQPAVTGLAAQAADLETVVATPDFLWRSPRDRGGRLLQAAGDRAAHQRPCATTLAASPWCGGATTKCRRRRAGGAFGGLAGPCRRRDRAAADRAGSGAFARQDAEAGGDPSFPIRPKSSRNVLCTAERRQAQASGSLTPMRDACGFGNAGLTRRADPAGDGRADPAAARYAPSPTH